MTTTASLIPILHKEHKNIARLLDALEHQVSLFEKGLKPDYDVLQDIAEYFCDFPDRWHHPKEDVVLRKLRAKCPDAAAKVGDLAREHRDAAARARQFRDTVRAVVGDEVLRREMLIDAGRRFVDAEREHMKMEEAVFFPAARKLLDASDWLEIGNQLRQERDPLFGESVEQEYRMLRERLLAWESEYRPG